MENTYVVKIGSSVLFTRRNRLDEYRITHIADQIAKIRSSRIGVILIISGAIGCGSRYIDINNSDLINRRLAAGVGQAYLTSAFYGLFKEKGLKIAQILLKKGDFYVSDISHLCKLYIAHDIIPIVNENDVLELNSFKGNDYLGAEIAVALHATKFVMLSTMQGSVYGVGGGGAKQEVIRTLTHKHIKSEIVNGKVKNILLNTIL